MRGIKEKRVVFLLSQPPLVVFGFVCCCWWFFFLRSPLFAPSPLSDLLEQDIKLDVLSTEIRDETLLVFNMISYKKPL